MNTETLYEFLVLSHTLNFSKAAEILYISQSVLSRHIQELEKTFDVVLFTRSTHVVTLTEAGVVLAQRAETLIDQCDGALAENQHLLQTSEKTLKVGCVLELAYSEYITNFMAVFRSHHRDVDVQLQILADGTTEEMLLSHEFDILFTPCEFINTAKSIHAHFIKSHSLYAIVPEHHRFNDKNLLLMQDLIGEQLLVPFKHELFGPYAKTWKIVAKFTNEQITAKPVANLPTALFETAAGQGILLAPAFAKHLAPAGLHFIELSNRYCRYNEYLYFNQTNHNPLAQAFYDEFCQTYFYSGIEPYQALH